MNDVSEQIAQFSLLIDKDNKFVTALGKDIVFMVICNLLWKIKCEQIAYSDIEIGVIKSISEDAQVFVNNLVDEWINYGLKQVPFMDVNGISSNSMEKSINLVIHKDNAIKKSK